jgi:predicted DNA binding protein
VPEEPDRLLIATLQVHIPKGLWTLAFSTAHPMVRLEVLNQSLVDSTTSVSDYWIGGGPPGVWAREIATNPDVLKVDPLAEVGDGSFYRVTYRNPPIVYLFRELRVPFQFPLRIQAGILHIEVVARQSEFRRIFEYARRVDPRAQAVSIRRRPLRNHLPVLTTSQQALLTRAMAEGYFAVPRRITLTELAHVVHRSKSSVSEAIALIEQKLLESAVRPMALAS